MALIQAVSPTGRSQIDDAIATSFIRERWQAINTSPKIGLLIASLFPVTPEAVNSLQMDIIVHDEMTGAAAVAENAAAPEVAMNTGVVSLTGQQYGLRAFLLNLAMRLGIGKPLGKAQDGVGKAHISLMHTTTLGLFNSFALSTGDNAATLDLEAWDLLTGLHRVQNHGHSDLWACFAGAGIRQLRADLRTQSAALYGSSFGEAAARALLNTTPGMGVDFDGYKLYESDDCPVGDTTGRTGALGVGGMNEDEDENACFGRAVWEFLEFKASPDDARFGMWVIAGTVWGIGIIKNSSGRSYIHSNS